MKLNIRTIAVAILFASPALHAAQDYRDPNFDYFVSGDPAQPRATHTEFGLALMGGGGSNDAAFAFIAGHGGFGHMVILRAVSDDSFDPDSGYYGQGFMDKWGPVKSAETIVFHHREASFDPRVLKALADADGIFLAGGDQANYINYWKGTPVETALNAHVRANRPIGGSSAGLAILGHYSYTSLDGGSLESKAALKDPLSSAVTLESNFMHFAHLESVITDTHFSKRCRLGRLIVFLARISADHPKEKIFGIGVDERSAVLIDEDGHGRLAEGSAGKAWIVTPASRPKLSPGHPLDFEVNITLLGGRSTLDTRTGGVQREDGETTLTLKNGDPVGPSFALPILRREQVPEHEG